MTTDKDREDELHMTRRICTALITSTKYIQQVESFWQRDLLGTDLSRIVSKWCFDFYRKYNKAPGPEIEAILSDRRKQLDPDTAEQADMLIRSLSDEYTAEGQGINVDYLLDQTRRYFSAQAMRYRNEQVSTLLEHGEIEQARELLEKPLPTFDDEIQEVVTGSDVKCKPIQWLMPNVIPRGYLTLIAGQKNAGKTLFGEFVSARLSRGESWHVIKGRAPRSDTLVMTIEDDAPKMIVPRFRAAGGDTHRIHIAEGIAGRDEDGNGFIDLWNVKNLRKLEQWLDQYPRVGLVWIDPVGDFMPEQKRGVSSAYQHVRRALAPLAKLASRREIAVVLTTHTRKGHEGTALEKIIDSTGFTTLARMVLMMAPDPDEPDTRGVLAVVATNLVKRPWLSFSYRVDSLEVDTAMGEQPVIVFEGASNVTAEELMQKPQKPEEKLLHEEIQEWVRDQLANSEDGWLASNDLFKLGAGQDYSKGQLYRALRKVARKEKKRGSMAGLWGWRLNTPATSTTSLTSSTSKLSKLSNLSKILLYRSNRKLPLAAIQRRLRRQLGHDVTKHEVRAALKDIGAAWEKQNDGSRRYYIKE